MLQDHERHIPVKVRCGGRKKFAEGGLATAAADVADAGRYGDDIVVHVNRREFEEMMQRWGEPTVNPDTGLPEFFLGDLWDGAKDLWDDAKDYIIPIGSAAAGAFLPIIGETVGSFLPGAADFLGSTGLQALSTGLLGAGAGYLLGGGKGALLGGLGGAAGAYGADLYNNGLDGSAIGQALAAMGGGAGAAGAAAGGVGGMGGSALTPALMMAALNLAGSALQGEDKGLAAGEDAMDDANDQFNKPLPQWENKRKRRVYPYGVPDYTQEGEREYFENNGFADGGRVNKKDQSRAGDYDPGVSMDVMLSETGLSPLSWIGYMMGLQQDEPVVADGKVDRQGYADGGMSHGRSDDIEALLSENEYVIDAETVALLGNGSPEAGAAQLDRLRHNVRKHKGSALAQGMISPDALPIEHYLG